MMNKHTAALFAAVLPFFAWTGQAAGPAFRDDFDTYLVGQTFASPTNGWQASGGSVMVTNDVFESAPNSVVIPRSAALTNTVGGESNQVIWTDCQWKPVAGDLPSDLPLETASLVAYCNPSGYVQVASSSGWLTCSNDVWGNAIMPAGVGFIRVSIYQNYSASNAAMFVNGHLVVQDLPFIGSANAYNTLTLASQSSNQWVDNVWIKTNYDSGTLTNDVNGNGLADAAELAVYGYAGRILYVGSGPGVPWYGSFQAAADVARPLDSVYVHGGNYTDDLVVSNAVIVGGVAFTNSGTLTIKAGVSPVFQKEMMWGAISLDTNSSTIWGQALSCDTFWVRAAATTTVQVLTCTNLVVEDGASLTTLGALQCVNSALLGSNVTAAFSNTVTCGGSVTVGTNSSATFSQALTCTTLVVRAGATVSVASLVCSNLVVEPGAHFSCLGAFQCDSTCLIDDSADAAFLGSVSCPGSVTVASSAAVSLSQGATLGALVCTGNVTVAAGRSLTVASAVVQGAVYVGAGGTATVTTALSMPVGGHMDFTQGRFLFSPLSVNLSGSFSISNNWGATSDVWVSENANCVFNQSLVCGAITVYAAATSTFQAVNCSTLNADDAGRLTVLGAFQSAGNVIIGQNALAGFSNTVACGASVVVGTNSMATFVQEVSCTTLVVRAGATVTVASLTCSNLVVEPGANFTCLGAFQCDSTCSIGANAVATFSGTVSCPVLSVATGATVTLGQGATLSSLLATGTVVVGAGKTLTVDTATVAGGLQATASGTVIVNTSLSVTGGGVLSFTNSRLTVPLRSVDLTGTFTIDSSWGEAAVMGLPFNDNFERYVNGARITDLGFTGWGATATNVVIQTAVYNTALGGSKALSIPSATVVSNRISTPARKVWTDCYVRPMLGGAPFFPPTNTVGFIAFVDSNGWLEIATSNGWDVCSNLVSGGQPDVMSTSSWTRVSVCQNLTNNTVAVFVNGKLVRELMKAPGVAPSEYRSFTFDNLDGQAYLDDVAIGENWPRTLGADLDHDYAPDAYEVDLVGSVTARDDLLMRGSVYFIR